MAAPRWERTLRLLHAQAKESKARWPEDGRVAWRLKLRGYADFSLRPLLQRPLKKKDGYSSGQVLRPEELQDLLAFLSRQARSKVQ